MSCLYTINGGGGGGVKHSEPEINYAKTKT